MNRFAYPVDDVLPAVVKRAGDDLITPAVDVRSASIDEAKMAVSNVPISTPTIDRVGDVLLPKGLVLDNYRKNPVVLFDHGLSDEPQATMPIASSRSPDGKLAVRITNDAVLADAYFHGQTKLSNQVFALIVAKAISAASVRALFLAGRDTREANVVTQWDMAEWSFVGVPCNPDCTMNEPLVKALQDRRINVGGKVETLSDVIWKSFYERFSAASAQRRDAKRKTVDWPTPPGGRVKPAPRPLTVEERLMLDVADKLGATAKKMREITSERERRKAQRKFALASLKSKCMTLSSKIRTKIAELETPKRDVQHPSLP